MPNQFILNRLYILGRYIGFCVKHISSHSIKYIFFLIIYQVVLYSQVYGQTISVSGRITSGRISLQNASVIFINASDTTQKISTLTNNLGHYQIDLVTSVKSISNNIPEKFELAQNYPNPFSASTAIPYSINEQSEISLTIYDVLGRKVRNFTAGTQRVGDHNLIWDGRDDLGARVANGIYFYVIQSNGESLAKKMILTQDGNNSIIIPNLYTATHNTSLNHLNKPKKSEGNVYTIRVENTNTTIPLLVPQILENITVQKDTTINISVTYIPLATLKFDSLHQVISGYGAATPWYLPAATESEIESAFGTGDGQIGFTIFRLTIEPDSNNWSKWVPSAKKAYEMGAKIIASPWHAPTEMREQLPEDYRVRYDMYDDYAAHLNSFARYMADNGAPVFGISIQNEPDIGDWTRWTSTEMLTFMRDNAHAITGTNVMSPESYHFDRAYSDPILNDSAACANTDIICGHIYGGGLFSYPLAEEKGKEVWMTEYLMGENNSGNNMYWAMELAENMHDVMIANMNAYIWWTMIRYYGPIGDGQTAANPQDPRETYPAKGEVTKKGFVMSQFSRFIRPGFYRVECQVAPYLSGVEVTAYKHPSSSKIVLVVINYNSDETEKAFRLGNDIMTSTFTPYTTSEVKNCERGDLVNVINGSFLYTLDPISITTFVSE